MVILEGWSWSKPVLMTAECHLPEGFASGAAVRIGTAEEAILSGLQTLAEMTPAERTAMGARGRKLVTTRFGWKQIAGQIGEVHRWLLGGGLRPSCFVDV